MRDENSKGRRANDIQVGGDHYRRIEGEQHWDRAVRLQFDPFQYQITKYVERCWEKNGIQDLEKARHFIDKYIEVARAQQRRGAAQIKAAEANEEFMQRLEDTLNMAQQERDWLLNNKVVTPTGKLELKLAEYSVELNCLQGKPSDFTYEGGYGDGRTRWRCTTCREWFYTHDGALPWAEHIQPCVKAQLAADLGIPPAAPPSQPA